MLTNTNAKQTKRVESQFLFPSQIAGGEKKRWGMSFANFKAPTPPEFALTPAEAGAGAEPEVLVGVTPRPRDFVLGHEWSQ